MGALFFKFLLSSFFWISPGDVVIQGHPIFVSVTEIEHNKLTKTLEISCKVFTDDFEKTLRSTYKMHVDLSDKKIKPAMDRLVNDYIQKHLSVTADGKRATLKYLGFEQIEEGIFSYYEAENISQVKKLTITDDVLFENHPEQISLIHAIVGGERKSTKLNNPDRVAEIIF